MEASLASRYQLGFTFQAGAVILPPKASGYQ
jgi:hypothetical protein